MPRHCGLGRLLTSDGCLWGRTLPATAWHTTLQTSSSFLRISPTRLYTNRPAPTAGHGTGGGTDGRRHGLAALVLLFAALDRLIPRLALCIRPAWHHFMASGTAWLTWAGGRYRLPLPLHCGRRAVPRPDGATSIHSRYCLSVPCTGGAAKPPFRANGGRGAAAFASPCHRAAICHRAAAPTQTCAYRTHAAALAAGSQFYNALRCRRQPHAGDACWRQRRYVPCDARGAAVDLISSTDITAISSATYVRTARRPTVYSPASSSRLHRAYTGVLTTLADTAVTRA